MTINLCNDTVVIIQYMSEWMTVLKVILFLLIGALIIIVHCTVCTVQ